MLVFSPEVMRRWGFLLPVILYYRHGSPGNFAENGYLSAIFAGGLWPDRFRVQAVEAGGQHVSRHLRTQLTPEQLAILEQYCQQATDMVSKNKRLPDGSRITSIKESIKSASMASNGAIVSSAVTSSFSGWTGSRWTRMAMLSKCPTCAHYSVAAVLLMTPFFQRYEVHRLRLLLLPHDDRSEILALSVVRPV